MNLTKINSLRIFIVLISILLSLSCQAEAKTYKLFFLGGQSNMDGYGLVDDLPLSLNSETKGVMIFHGNSATDAVPVEGHGHWSALRPGHGGTFTTDSHTSTYTEWFGPELTFGYRMKQLFPKDNIAIIKYSRGGSSIDCDAVFDNLGSCWDPDYTGGVGEGYGVNQYDHFLATVKNAMADDDIDNDGEIDTLIPEGIIWMQGESDANGNISNEVALRYKENLKKMIYLFRNTFSKEDLPVAIGLIADSMQYEGGHALLHDEIVRAAQAEFVKEDNNAILVTTTENYSYFDPWHFDTFGIIDLGKKFADAIATLQNNNGNTTQIFYTDLAVEESGIRFTDQATGLPVMSAEQGNMINIEADIHNLSNIDPPDLIKLSIFENDIEVGSATTQSIANNSMATIAIPWQVGKDSTGSPIPGYTDGYKTIFVHVEYLQNIAAPGTYPEVSNDNNVVSSFFTVGLPSGEPGITLENFPLSNNYTNSYSTISGRANYNWGSKMPLLNSPVSIDLNGVTYNQRTTGPSGTYAASVNLPADSGEYPLSVQTDDNNLRHGKISISNIIDLPAQPAADLKIYSINFSGSGIYEKDGTTYSAIGNSINIAADISNNGGLDAGQSFNVSFYDNDPLNNGLLIGTANVDNLLSGTSTIIQCPVPWTPANANSYSIYAVVDSDAAISESNETNNQILASINVRNALPDLQPYSQNNSQPNSGIYFSSRPVIGESVTIFCDVYNTGPAELSAGKSFNINFYDGDPSNWGLYLGSSTLTTSANMGVGEKLTASFNWNTSTTTAGTHKIYVHVDPDQIINEDFSTNNKSTISLDIHPVSEDIWPSDLLFSNYAPLPGSSMNLTARLKNNGGNNSLTTEVEIYLGDPALNGALLGQCTTSSIPSRGGESECSINISVPNSVGSIALFIKIPSNGRTYSEILTIYPLPQADLQVVSEGIYHVNLPGIPTTGSEVTISADIENIGTNDAYNFDVKFFIDSQAGLQEIGSSVTVPFLGAGMTTAEPVSATLPFIVTEPVYSVKVLVNPKLNGDIKLDNNEATTSFWVYDPSLPDADTDYIPDQIDNCPNTFNIDQSDLDGDNVGDACDTCFGVNDNLAPNEDGDNYPDACDAFPSDPTEWADTDMDGVGDNSDACPGWDDSINSDGDPIPDACDPFPSDPTEWADADGDGIGDNADSIILPESAFGDINDAPHDKAHGVSCKNCHTYSLWWHMSPVESNQAVYKNLTNTICFSCHGANGLAATVKPHKYESFGIEHIASFGNWSVNCLDCHDPHLQSQLYWRDTEVNNLYLITGTIGTVDTFSVSEGNTTFAYLNKIENAEEWKDVNLWSYKNNSTGRGLIFVEDKVTPANTFEIIAADSATITIKGLMSQKASGKSFGIIYGQMIKSSITNFLPENRFVKFFNPKSLNGGYTDFNTPPTGVCQVCHLNTSVYNSYDGDGSGHYNGNKNCTECHKMAQGFSTIP